MRVGGGLILTLLIVALIIAYLFMSQMQGMHTSKIPTAQSVSTESGINPVQAAEDIVNQVNERTPK